MAEKPIKDSPRAVDASDMLKRARRRAMWKLLGQAVAWGALIVLIVLAWRCLSGILEYSAETEVPTREQPLE